MESCGALISLFFVCFFSITCCCGAAPTDLWFCSALQKKKKKVKYSTESVGAVGKTKIRALKMTRIILVMPTGVSLFVSAQFISEGRQDNSSTCV